MESNELSYAFRYDHAEHNDFDSFHHASAGDNAHSEEHEAQNRTKNNAQDTQHVLSKLLTPLHQLRKASFSIAREAVADNSVEFSPQTEVSIDKQQSQMQLEDSSKKDFELENAQKKVDKQNSNHQNANNFNHLKTKLLGAPPVEFQEIFTEYSSFIVIFLL
jgi:hypothetical protein